MESFATGLKRIHAACKEVGCRVEFVQEMDGFVVKFYRRNIDSLRGTPQVIPQVAPQVEDIMNQILQLCIVPKNKKEIMRFCGYKDSKHFTERFINPLLEEGRIAMTIPDKPNSKNQKYITEIKV